MRVLFALVLAAAFSACHSNISWVPDSNGRLQALVKESVKLPGLTYLSLGAPQHDALTSLRAHGFECNEEASTSQTQACIRAPSGEEPTGGVVMLQFEQAVLSGVQAQLQPPGDDTGKLAKVRFEEIGKEWSQSYGRPKDVHRPGITASRYSLRNGTALLLVRYDNEPTLIVEHFQLQRDQVSIPPPPRDTGTR